MGSLKWQKLLEKLIIIEDGLGTEILSSERLAAVEAGENIVLPEDYKELCRTLGTGLLADRVRIVSPTKEHIDSEKVRLSYAIERIQHYTATDSLRNLNQDQKFISLLESAFVFGDLYNAYSPLVWDLRTYNSFDNSYDIYYVDCNTPESSNPILLGRNFVEFVEDICQGTKLLELLPDMFEAVSFNELEYTFLQFKLYS